MNKVIKLLALSAIFVQSFNLMAQQNYSIEHEYHNVGVFNPEWEMFQSLNPNKFEHITGYFREQMARIIINAIESKRVKIYDIRKREITLDSVIKKIIDFEEKEFGNNIKKDSVFRFIIPYICAYQFEELVTYNYKTLGLEKRVKAYCPTIVRFKSFETDKIDTLQLPLFWIFPEEIEESSNALEKKKQQDKSLFIPDTVISLQALKYPVQNPYSTGLFEKIKKKDASILKPDGSRFKAPKEIDDLFIISKTIDIEDDESGVITKKTIYSDIIPEDITNIRIGELWSIDPQTLLIKKQVKYIIPLLEDERGYKQFGVRVQ